MDHSTPSYDDRLETFKAIVTKYNINYDFAYRLRALEGFEIVMIIDDSSSMSTPIFDQFQQNSLTPFDRLPTRWDEMKQTVSIVVDLASTLDTDGIDVYFLNRPPLLRVHNSSELDETFAHIPRGPTPITKVLSDVLKIKQSVVYDRKLLILIATDGMPTNEKGRNDLVRLEKVLRHERKPFEDRIFITFIACTNDLAVVGYLNRFDKKIVNVDVLDDYSSERAEIIAVQGHHFPFSFGDYVVKILMGSVDPWFDKLDEKPIRLNPVNANYTTIPNYTDIRPTRKSCVIS